jgi:hypothetical protein
VREVGAEEKINRDWPAILLFLLMVFIAGFLGGIISAIIVLLCM